MKHKILNLSLAAFFILALTSFRTVKKISLQPQENLSKEAVFSDQASFTPNADGFIVVEFEISDQLSSSEMEEVNELSSENKERLEITVQDTFIKVKLLGSLSNGHSWHKVFHSMNVELYTFGSAENEIQQPYDVFSNHFRLP